jgi:hypothetical protein
MECDYLLATDPERTVQLALLTRYIILADFDKISDLTDDKLDKTINLEK